MRITQNTFLDIRTFDYYDRYGVYHQPDDPLVRTGYGPGLRRPQFAAAGGVLFFLDNAGLLWKFDGHKVWELGLESFSSWEAWRPDDVLFASGTARLGPCGASIIDGYADMVGVPDKPVWDEDDEVYRVTVENFVAGEWSDIPASPHTCVWILGFPFMCETATYDGVSETWELEMLAFEQDEYNKYAWHTWDAFDAAWTEVGAANVPKRVVFAWDYSEDWDVGLFDSDTNKAAEVYHDGNLKGTYGYVMTLVTRDGYESNPCQEMTIDLDRQIAHLDIGRVSDHLAGDDEEDWPGYDDDYVRNLNIYRTYKDKPGVYYFHSTMPYGRVPTWWVQTPSTEDLSWFFFDNTPDEYLGERLHELKLMPRQGTAICSTRDTLIVADGTGVYVSVVGDPETFYTYLSYEGAVLGLAAMPFFDEFLVFLHNRIYAVNIFDYSQRLVCHGIGLAGRDAVAVMNDRILFQSHGGQIFQYTGSGVAPIPGSERINDLLTGRTTKRNLNLSQYSATIMAFTQKRNQVWVLLGEDGRHGNLVLVIQPNSAFLLYKFHASVQVTSIHCWETGGEEAIFLGLSDGTIVSFNPGAKSDHGVPIPLLIESGEIGLIDEQARIRRLYTEVISVADIDITISGRYDSRGSYVSEGVVHHEHCRDGDERHVNTYSDVVKAYQFKLEEESLDGFTLKAFSIIYQAKLERVRNWR